VCDVLPESQAVNPRKGQPIVIAPFNTTTIRWIPTPPHPDIIMCCGGSLQVRACHVQPPTSTEVHNVDAAPVFTIPPCHDRGALGCPSCTLVTCVVVTGSIDRAAWGDARRPRSAQNVVMGVRGADNGPEQDATVNFRICLVLCLWHCCADDVEPDGWRRPALCGSVSHR
jgi:hypothetical protein